MIQKTKFKTTDNVKLTLNNSFCKEIYDSGSNISIIRKCLLDSLKGKCFKLIDTKFKMANGHGNVIGIAKIKIKIFRMEKEVYVFVLNNFDFNREFLIGLDLINKFQLCQNQYLKISQRLSNNGRMPNRICHNIFVNKCEIENNLQHLDYKNKCLLNL